MFADGSLDSPRSLAVDPGRLASQGLGEFGTRVSHEEAVLNAITQVSHGLGGRRATAILLAPTALPLALALVVGRGGPLFYAGYAVALALLLAVAYQSRTTPFIVAAGFLVWLSISRIVLATLTGLLTPATITALLAWSEFFFPMLAVVCLSRAPHVWRESPKAVRALDVMAVAFLLLAAGGVLIGSAPLIDRVLYARRLGVLPLVYAAIRLAPWIRGDGLRIARLVVTAGVLLATFGLVERLLPAGLLWGAIAHPVDYYRMAAFSGGSAPVRTMDGLPMTFWTWIGGVPVRRLVSTSLEAATVGMFFAVAAVTAIALARPGAWDRRWIWAATLAGAACVFALGKAGIAILLAGAAYTLLSSKFRWLTRPWIVVLAAAAIAGGIVCSGVIAESMGVTAGVSRHLSGLVAGWDAMIRHPLGLGLGSTGVFTSSQTVAESSLGVLMAQLGVPGLLSWLTWIVGTGTVCIVMARRLTDAPALGVAVGASLISFMAASALTESTGGLLWNWIFALLAAVVICDGVARGHRVPRLHMPKARGA